MESAAENAPKVAVIGGTGSLGSALALQLARAGVPVCIGSRRLEAAAEKAQEISGQLEEGAAAVSGALNADAAGDAEIVFLTVPFNVQAENLKALKDVLHEGQILVDATVPLAATVGGKATQTLRVWQGSAAQAAAQLVPDGVTVVSALHSVSAVTLEKLEAPPETEDVLVMSDSKQARERISALIDLLPGLRAVNGGRLENAQIAEQLTALLIGINIRYKTHAGLRFTGLPEPSEG